MRAMGRASRAARMIVVLGLLVACGPAASPDHVVVEADSPATRGTALEEAISIETAEGQLATILEAGCPLPCSETVTFGIAEAGQREIVVYVFRGNASTTEGAVSLGRFEIADLPPGNEIDDVEVEVTFQADRTGVSLLVASGPDGGATIRRVAD